MKEQLEDIVAMCRTHLSDDKVFFRPYIPPKKLANALAEFGGQEDEDDVLVLVDNTVFGNAKDGLLLTRSALHVHNMMEPPFHLGLHEIDDVQFKDGLLECKVVVNGVYVFRSNMAKKPSMALLAEMLAAVGEVARQDAPCPTVPAIPDVKDALRELKALFDEGLLTEAEYSQKRQILVAQI
jgi:hypothetical protein